METNQSGFFRRKDGFTSVQNIIIRDPSISLKAKGLYLVIQSNITHPVKKFCKDDFKKMTLEGEKAFDSAWKELKETGYLKIHNYPNGQKNKFIVEFELLDSPKPGPHTFYYNKNKERTATNEEHRERCIQSKEEKVPGYHLGLPRNGVPAKGVAADGVVAKGVPADGVTANGEDKETNTRKQDLNTNNQSLTHKVIGESERNSAVVVRPDEILMQGDIDEVEMETEDGINYELAGEVEFMKKVVMVLVNWNELLSDADDAYLRIYSQIVECLTQMATTTKPAVYKGSHVTYKNVIDRMNLFIENNDSANGAMHLWILELSKNVYSTIKNSEINNIKSYVKSMIWDYMETQLIRYQTKNSRIIG